MERDNVEWSNYNQSLVRRGEILLGFDVIDNWHPLQEMDKGKVGEPFHYPNTLLLFFAKKSKAYFHLPYREIEGIVKAHAENKVPSIPNYSTISRRINKLDIKIEDQNQEEKDDYIIVAIYSTGIKITNRGQWMLEKWNTQRRRGYLKIHLAVDVQSKRILSVKVTDEHKHDSKVLPDLIEGIA